MEELKKKNISLIVALSIPVLMVAIIAVSIFLPSLFIKPVTDFVYIISGGNNCYDFYKFYGVKNGIFYKSELPNPSNDTHCQNADNIRIYYHDIQNNQSREITSEEAQQYRLDDSPLSSDGFEIVHGNYSSDFFFSYSTHDDNYIKKGAYSRRLNIPKTYSYYGFKFIGWVKGENHG